MVVIYSGPETNVMQVQSGASLITGSVYFTNSSINIVGSPNYNLPTIGSQYVTQGTSPWAVSGTFLGSAQISSIVNALPVGTALLGSVKATPDGYYQILGSPNYSLPVIGSVQVSSITGALPAGTALLGSVKATPDGYYQVLGSPNYSLPVIGSVQVSSINSNITVGSLTAGILGSVYSVGSSTLTGGDGSIWVTSSSTTIISPLANRRAFTVVGGSVASNNVSSKWWCSLTSAAIVGKGMELVTNQIWGLEGYTGSVFGITDAGSILVGYTQI